MRSRVEIETESSLATLGGDMARAAAHYGKLAMEVALDTRELLLAQQSKVTDGDLKALKAEVEAQVEKLKARIEFLEGGMKRIIEQARDHDAVLGNPTRIIDVIDGIANHALNPTNAYIPAIVIRRKMQQQFDEAQADPDVLKEQGKS